MGSSIIANLDLTKSDEISLYSQLINTYIYSYPMNEGSLAVKLPTIWTYGKAGVGRVRQEKSRREKIREEKRVGEKKMQVREKVAKSRNTAFFQ